MHRNSYGYTDHCGQVFGQNWKCRGKYYGRTNGRYTGKLWGGGVNNRMLEYKMHYLFIGTY